MNLDEATTLTSLGAGRFGVDLREEFAIGMGKPNGGYMLACLGRAAVTAASDAGAEHPHPIATGVQYVRSPDLGPAEIETTVIRVGRSASQVEARLVQDGSSGVVARFTLGRLHEGSDPFWGDVAPVDVAPIDECAGFGGFPGRPDNGTRLVFDPRFTLVPTAEGLTGEGNGELRAWFSFSDGRAVTPVELLYVCDSMPPATFQILSTGWVPTLDLTAYVRAVPAPGPLRLRFRAQVIQDGFADEVMDVWDSAGRLVAQSSQLCALRMPA